MDEYLIGGFFFGLFMTAIYPLSIERQCVAICTSILGIALIIHSSLQI
jgi:hypothetical protein